MRLSRTSTNMLRVAVGVTLAFIYIPLIVVAIYAFNGGSTFQWPPESLTTHWFGTAIDNQGARDAGPPRRAVDVGQGRRGGDGDRPRPRHTRVAGRLAPRLLRPRDGFLP